MKRLIVRSLSLGLVGLVALGAMAAAIAIPFQRTLNRSVTDSPSQSSEIANANNTLIWPAVGEISQGFHRYHEGIDIAGPVGTPILAARDGIVVVSGWDDWGLGNAIALQHEDGTRTIYGHNQRLFVREGDFVRQGQTIAEMGSTGNSTGPHLHFEVRPDGVNAVNPKWLLPIEYAAGGDDRNDATGNAIALAAKREGCEQMTVLSRETRNFRIQVCLENGQYFYFGQPKDNPDASVWLPARAIAEGFLADNGSYTYRVRRDRVDVLRNGLFVRSERFL